jgi:hypothetical protein
VKKKVSQGKKATSAKKVKVSKKVASEVKGDAPVRQFNTADDQKRFVRGLISKIKDKVLKSVLKVYGVDGYLAMNLYLRKGRVDSTLLRYAGVPDEGRLKQMVKRMKDAFAKGAHRLEEDLIVHRATDHPMKLKVGSTFTDKGFVSTSLSDVVAGNVVSERGGEAAPVMFRIRLPKGTSVLPGNDWESELILAPDSTFRVVSASKERRPGSSKPVTIYELELVS